MAVKEGAGCLLAGVGSLIVNILGIVIHVITIVMAFDIKGLFAAVVSALLPVFAQMYWIYKLWDLSGVFLNWYTVMILIYVVGIGIAMGGAGLLASTEK